MTYGNVLVVEDDDTIRRLLVEYLEQHSHVTVDSARDGIEALHQIAVKSYGIVVLDVIMPKMSGVDFLSSLDAMLSDPSIRSFDEPPRVLVITSTPAAELPQKTLQERYPRLVHRVFRKPLDFTELGKTVTDSLSR